VFGRKQRRKRLIDIRDDRRMYVWRRNIEEKMQQ